MENILGSVQSLNFTPPVVLFNLVFVFILVMVISWAYRKTHHGLSYSQSFNFTLVVMGLLISVVMMVIGSNIAIAFGALGAFSLIRFRTAVKDIKDTSFVFFSVAIGMASGTGNYMLALIATIFIVVTIVILDMINFGSIKKFNYILSLSMDNESNQNGVIKEIFKKYTKEDSLLNVSARNNGKSLDMTFHVYLEKDDVVGDFISSLEGAQGIDSVNIVATKDDVEY